MWLDGIIFWYIALKVLRQRYFILLVLYQMHIFEFYDYDFPHISYILILVFSNKMLCWRYYNWMWFVQQTKSIKNVGQDNRGHLVTCKSHQGRSSYGKLLLLSSEQSLQQNNLRLWKQIKRLGQTVQIYSIKGVSFQVMWQPPPLYLPFVPALSIFFVYLLFVLVTEVTI